MSDPKVIPSAANLLNALVDIFAAALIDRVEAREMLGLLRFSCLACGKKFGIPFPPTMPYCSSQCETSDKAP